MKERLVGFGLMCAVVPLAIVGYFVLVWIGLFGPNGRGRAGVGPPGRGGYVRRALIRLAFHVPWGAITRAGRHLPGDPP